MILSVACDGEGITARPADDAQATAAGGLAQGWNSGCGRLEVLTSVFDANADCPFLKDPVSAEAFLLRIRTRASVDALTFRFGWETAPRGLDGDSDGGQGREGRTYEGGGYRVTLGTEDAEALRARAAHGDGISRRVGARLRLWGEPASDRTYYPFHWDDENALLPTLRGLLPGDELELVFEVAWQPLTPAMVDPETDECGTWYAVDTARAFIRRPHAAEGWNPES